jgi:NADH dehydrogenase (ubiquinone) 1 beta subcomplex subunit 11
MNWVVREAFLELDRREREGLPLISPDYVDPSKVDLPEMDDVCECDIII